LCAALAAPLAAAQSPSVVDGVLDLGAPGATGTTHAVRGTWRFDWSHFAPPSADELLPGTAPVPSAWNNVTADGKPPGGEGFGSYAVVVKCPMGEQLALSVPAQRTALRLFVNGRLVASQGSPGASPPEARPAIGRRAVLTEPFPCPLRITAHLSNYSHRAGGMIRAPVVGPIDELASQHQQRLALDTILLGAYFVLAILGLTFYVARRKEKVPLLFGLFALAMTFYVDMNGDRLLLQLAGAETSWEPFLRIEYFAWFSSMSLFLLVVDHLFPRAMGVLPVRLLAGGCALAMLAVATTPGRVYSHLVYYGQALGVAIGVYVSVVMTAAGRQGRKDAGVILVGMGFLAVVLLTDLWQFFQADATQNRVTALGLLAFVLSPAMVLLRRLARLLSAEELRSAEQREKVDLLVRATQAGILDWSQVRDVTIYSARLLEMLGYPRDTDTSDWPVFFERVDPADRPMVEEAFRQQMSDRSVRSGELRHDPLQYRLLRRDGSTVWVHAEAISLRAPDGRTLRYICSFLDITDQRALADGLKRQNAALAENAQLREDVERMSRHDLKTPLNSIIGVARLLREDEKVPTEQRELLAIAERAGYRLLEMVNLSLDLSRMELGSYDFRPQAVNVMDVIARVQQDLKGQADAAGVEVRLETTHAEPLYARAEELLCYSILCNLVKNAIEAAPAGSVVRVSVAPGEPLQVDVHNAGQVPNEIAPRFFDKYVSGGKSGGLGLGTYSARLMARVQDGDLEMMTGEAGTTLSLKLRALGKEQLPPPRRAGAAAAPTGPAHMLPRRVLVVDDDEYNRLLLLRYLPSPPFDVETAADGRGAVEAVTRHWPDIVLIDMEMPVMNGLEAVLEIRAREARSGGHRCLIVMMSSNDDPISIRRGLEAGSNRFLTKPFTRETLLATFQELEGGGARVPVQVPLALEEPRPAHQEPVAQDAPVTVDRELLAEIPAFLDSRRAMVDAMAAALDSGNRAQLRALAHRAAGGLALFGFQWAAWQGRRISARAAEGDAQSLQEDIARLRRHLQEVEVQ
jgi:signal transduction histidine kinase/CheY-like chemotaxis protein/HPt (histidine-containing phosphotransfer) domain-containing protein